LDFNWSGLIILASFGKVVQRMTAVIKSSSASFLSILSHLICALIFTNLRISAASNRCILGGPRRGAWAVGVVQVAIG
jgi:hypothetical protein